MKNQFKKGVKSVAVATILLSGFALPTESSANENVYTQVASVNQFKDVSSKHWAKPSIDWAFNKGIIKGYPDGTFGAERTVSEAEFVSMVTNFLRMEAYSGALDTNKAHWADKSYDAFAEFGVPAEGYYNQQIRNQPIDRGSVAITLTHLVGKEADLDDSIEYLLENNITKGQYPEYANTSLRHFFGVNNNLSRAEIVTFLHRLEQQNLNFWRLDVLLLQEQEINANAKMAMDKMNSYHYVTKPVVVPEEKVEEKPEESTDGVATTYNQLLNQIHRHMLDFEWEFTIKVTPELSNSIDEGELIKEIVLSSNGLNPTLATISYGRDIADTSIQFNLSPKISQEQREKMDNFLNENSNKINNMNLTNSEKVIEVSKIINSLEKSPSPDLYFPSEYTLLDYGSGACAEYTVLGTLLLDRVGIDSLYVTGYAPSGGWHAWNMVNVDGEWLNFDITWKQKTLKTKSEMEAVGYKFDAPTYLKAIEILNSPIK